VDTLNEELRNTWMYEAHGEERMLKGDAFDWLSAVVLEWEGDHREILIAKESKLPKLSDVAYEHFMDNGVDMSGSPGTEEQHIINMLAVTYPYIPTGLATQLIDFMSNGHELIGFDVERKIGAVFSADGTSRFTEGGARAHAEGKFNPFGTTKTLH